MLFFMGVNVTEFTRAIKPYEILNIIHALVMSVFCVMEYTIFSLVTVKMTVTSYIQTLMDIIFCFQNSVHITTEF